METIIMKIRTLSLLICLCLFLAFLPGRYIPRASAAPIDLYGVTVDETTEYIDLRRRHIEDNGEALLAALPALSSARYLDLDNCGLSDFHKKQLSSTDFYVRI